MRTLLTKKQQADWLNTYWRYRTLQHKWSTRGLGSSRILDANGESVARAGGCGYDRKGAAFGNAITAMFPQEIYTLARRHCAGKRRNYKPSEKLYGLFYDAKNKRAWVDGGCGFNCMVDILNAIGFTLAYVGETSRSNNGDQFYTLSPIDKSDRERLARR